MNPPNSDELLFLGTGVMGAPMTGNLARNGARLHVWNRSFEKAEALRSDRITPIRNFATLAPARRVAFVMVNDGAAADHVLFGDIAHSGLQGILTEGSLVIVMSSIPVETAQAQAKKLSAGGVRYIDAPVSGGEKGAIEGTLAIMAGGEAQDIDHARRFLEAMGRVTHVGPVGSGQLAKLANQAIVGITIGAVAEALLLAEAGGANPPAVRAALLGGFADSAILRQHGARMLKQDFAPGARARIQLKDAATAEKLAEKLGLDAPFLRLSKDLFAEMAETSRRDLDHSALFLHLKDRQARTTAGDD